MQLQPSQRWLAFAQACLLAALVSSCSTGGDVTAPSDAISHNRSGATPGANAWQAMNSGTTELLWGVTGSSGEVIAVGTRGTAIHLESDTWQGKPTQVFRDLCDAWSAADGRAISVGTFGTIISYDGATPAPVAGRRTNAADSWEPVPSGTEHGLYDIWGFEEYQAVAVGDSGTILEFDGTAWASVPGVTDITLFGVWGSSPGDVFAVGVGGTILHHDGNAWAFMNTPTPENLNAVWGTASNNVWAVGDTGMLIHYNGIAWQPVAQFGTNLYDVWGAAANDVRVVGKAGRILHYDGNGWNDEDSGTQQDLFGVWGRSADEVYAVGDAGTVLRWGPEPVSNDVLFVLHDHPDGTLAPPQYGLRIDDLLGTGRWTFSFDYSDGDEDAYVTLACDETAGTMRIQGRAYGGQVVNNAWSQDSRGWIDIDFTYASNFSIKDDCGALSGDDYYVTSESLSNAGTITLDGWGGNQVFAFTDRSGENNGCSFIFDNDEDAKGDPSIASDPATWSGSGWLQPATNGSRDWLFTGEKVPIN